MASIGFLPMKVWLNEEEPEDPYRLCATEGIPPKPSGTMRLWVDGCFDLMHFGHANLLRQAYFRGVQLNGSNGPIEVLVGCHSDEEILKVKGPPIMHEEERYNALRACKWATYVVENYPYSTRLKDMERFEVDYVIHGDDVSMDENGRNSYQEIIDAGKFEVVRRTESISTTELVGRMLLCTRDHQLQSLNEVKDSTTNFSRSNYLTTKLINLFSNNRTPKPGAKIVYVDGGFDLFHVGHIHVLRQAREMGDYLFVGLYEDKTINDLRGMNYPIMNFNERLLGLLSCRYVDEVILGVSFEIPEVLIKTFNISVVVKGNLDVHDPELIEKCYAVPKAMNILAEVDSGYPLTTDFVIERVLNNRIAYMKRQAEKAVKDKKSEEFKPSEYRNVNGL